jgi:uncharacterized SAM-binding protein YcdF (DUF218 family)
MALHPELEIFINAPYNVLPVLIPMLIWRRLIVVVISIIGAVLFGYIQYTPIFSGLIAAIIEKPQDNVSNSKPAQAIVVLGSGVVLHDGVRFLEEDNRIRLDQAYKVSLMFPELPLLLSGGGNQVSVMANYMQQLGYTGKFLLEDQSKDTAEEAVFIKHKFPDLHRVILVTEAFHMWRAKMLFEKLGAMQVSPYPAKNLHCSDLSKLSFLQLITPSLNSKAFSSNYIHEVVGYFRGLLY